MKKLIALLVLVFFAAATICAQEAPPLPKPGPEHAKLGFFVGKWTHEGELKPSPYGPSGKFTFMEDCDWLPGNFAVVCHTQGQMFGMTVTGMSILSYDLIQKDYVYFETNNIGENTFSRGTVNGDTWTWTNEAPMNGKIVHTRFTLKQLGNDSASYKFEMGAGSDPFALIMEGKETRIK